jgi:hypothetical protein
VIKEPKPTKECVVCKKENKTVEIYGDADAFCSSTCCREYFGTQLPLPEKGVAVGASS